MSIRGLTGLLFFVTIIVTIFCGGIAVADPIHAEGFGDINFQLVSENYTFPLDNGSVIKNYWAEFLSGNDIDRYNWSISAVLGGPVVLPADNYTLAPKNYDNHTFANPGKYTLFCVGWNLTAPPNSTARSTTFLATKTIAGNITYAPTGINNLVNFTYLRNSTSPWADRFEWNFGDSKPNRTVDNNATTFYQYSIAGNYTVVVTASNLTPGFSEFILASSNSTTATVNASPVANFWIAGNYTKNVTPFLAEFHNNSTNATGYTWQYGDGVSEDNLNLDVSHQYNVDGRYQVNLTARSAWGTNTTSQLLIGYTNISANFTYVPSTCPAFPVNVTFRNNSTGSAVDRWNLTFGDGSSSGNVTSSTISHFYQLPQTYHVTMRAYNDTFEINNTTSQDISVTGLYANFTRTPPAGPPEIHIFRGQKATVFFNSTSVGTDGLTYYDWNFGNNLTDTYKNVSSQFSAGIFNVSLTITNRTCGGSNTTTQQVKIYEWLTTGFTYAPAYGGFPLLVQFADNSTDTPDQFNWKFYDLLGNVVATNTTSSRPTNIYNTPGTYRVDLVTRNALGEESDILTQYITLTSGISADFYSNRSTGVTPLAVQFSDNSSQLSTITNRTWNFGDGTTNSTETNPYHVFNQAGNFTITMTAWNASSGSTNTKQKVNYISVGTPVRANFAPNSSFKVNTSMLVNFTDLSTPANQITNWSWNFGDNQSSQLQNPIHQYSAIGVYNVSLNVSNWFYQNSNVTNYFVNITEIKIPVAKFEGNPRTITTNQSVSFADKSEGPEINAWNWNFGDETNSNATNPVHEYTYAGMYDVSLVASNPYGSGSTTEVDYIKVKGPVIADFVTDPSGWGVVNQPVSFIDTSLGQPISWIWNFGDGNTTTTSVNPIAHTYTSPGWYTINMTGTNWDGQSGTAVRQIQIEDKARPRDVNFDVVGMKYSGTHPLTVQFVDQTPSQSNVTEWYWDFGDRTNAFNTVPVAPSHTYVNPGEYTVTLTVRNNAGVNEKIRVAYVVVV